MLQNKYMDTTTPKSFVDDMLGCTEHQFKLATALQEARKEHQSLTICWLDLANAYRSVHHQLIQLTITMHPVNWSALQPASTLASRAAITTPAWATAEIFSRLEFTKMTPTVIFIIVMCTLIEALRPLQHLHGVPFSQSECIVHYYSTLMTPA